MTEQEKKDNPNFYIQNGYLKEIEYKDAWKKVWCEISEVTKNQFKQLPNFDEVIFEEITGIKL